MDSSEEPFVVWTDINPFRIFIKCKNPSDRSMVRKRLKLTVILRGFRNDLEDGVLVKEFASGDKMDKQFALIISTMVTMRRIIK